MTTISSRFETLTRVLPVQPAAAAESFNTRLSELYALSQESNYMFASPLGPVFHGNRHLHVPRFVYFGPHTHDHSLRLAFLGGFDSTDLRTSIALGRLVEELLAFPDLGQGLNLSVFPLVDVLGLARKQRGRELGKENWSRTNAAEINVLEKDARARGYHGFIRLESTSEDETISARLRNAAEGPSAQPSIELVSASDFEPHSVRWETQQAGDAVTDGPLAAVDDLPVRPFELTLRFPKEWSIELHLSASLSILRNFISRQRALQAYRQHL